MRLVYHFVNIIILKVEKSPIKGREYQLLDSKISCSMMVNLKYKQSSTKTKMCKNERLKTLVPIDIVYL